MRQLRATFEGKSDLFALYDSGSEFAAACAAHGVTFGPAAWFGKQGSIEACAKLTSGDNSLVAPSEKLLSELEDALPHTLRYVNVADVVGALPNVPAYLAGQPQCMRRRARVASETAPISVVVDVTSSGAISTRDLLARGAALLAFVRLLSAHRAVSLWCGIGLNAPDGGSSMCLWRIDTTPLDLARAAHMLAAPSVSRGLGYGLSHKVHRSGGSWPFHSHRAHAATGEARLRAALGEQVHFIPPVLLGDDLLLKSPANWLRRELGKYLPEAA